MEKFLEFVGNNYIWFIVVGGVLLIVALLLLFVKKDPVKEEKVVDTTKPTGNDDVKIEEENDIVEVPVDEPMIQNHVNDSTLENKDNSLNSEPIVKEDNVDTSFSIDSVMNTPIAPVSDETETLDIIDEEPEENNHPTETNDFPVPEVQTENNVGEVNIPGIDINTDNANSTSDDDIWKF